jgi:uncharacterized protein
VRALLDVNVLIALLDRDHTHHRRARRWLDAEISHGWASCGLTQAGVARVMSSPGYPKQVSISWIVETLRRSISTQYHEFWVDPVRFTDPDVVDPTRIHGHRQVTDTHLLALAVHHGGRLATLDQRITTAAVLGATDAHIVVL